VPAGCTSLYTMVVGMAYWPCEVPGGPVSRASDCEGDGELSSICRYCEGRPPSGYEITVLGRTSQTEATSLIAFSIWTRRRFTSSLCYYACSTSPTNSSSLFLWLQTRCSALLFALSISSS